MQYSTFLSLYLFTQLGNDCDIIPHDTEFRCDTEGQRADITDAVIAIVCTVLPTGLGAIGC